MIERVNAYTNIRAWMSNDKNIKKNELVIYAYIHGWSYQKREIEDGSIEVTLGCYTGSITNLIEWTKLSRSTVIRALNSLVEKGYLVKRSYNLREGKNETRCIYYSAVSRIPGKVEELENTDFREKSPLDLLCDEVNDTFILTPGVCLSDTGDSVTLELNKLNDNLVNNTAAAEADAEIHIPPHVATKNHSQSDKALAAAVSFENKIKNIFGSNPFDKDFVPAVSDRIEESGMDLSLVEEFVSYVDERVVEKLEKKGGSHTNLFRFLCLAPDVLSDFVMSHSPEKTEPETRLTKICPVCSSEVDMYPGVCKCCGFDISYSDDKDVVSRELQIFRLDPCERAALREELDNVYYGCGLTLDPVKMKKQREMISAVYKKHSISCAETCAV